MSLVDVLIRFGIVTGGLCVLCSLLVIGPARLMAFRDAYRDRLRQAGPYLIGLGLVLGVNSLTRTAGAEISWLIEWNITSAIYSIEGEFIATLQSVSTPIITAFFSFVYIYGYGLLVVFPLIAYLVLADPTPLRETTIAYALNYGIGLIAYITIIAYGPRNFVPTVIEPLLYANYPQFQLLTRQVNVNTNVFPSLHTSLSLTVALMARRTRSCYPRWYPIATGLAMSIVVSTMYLGIHWATDVVAGALLAVVCVVLATRLTGPLQTVVTAANTRIRAPLGE